MYIFNITFSIGSMPYGNRLTSPKHKVLASNFEKAIEQIKKDTDTDLDLLKYVISVESDWFDGSIGE